jgi:hypothetical protein
MAVITKAELKARFTTADRPSQKDWDDLIDTLFEGTGTVTPGGPAGGDLAGAYPDPLIADGAVSFAKMQEINTSRLLGRSSAGVGNLEEVQVGSGLSLSGSILYATGADGGSGGSGTVAGAVNTYNSDLLDLPATDGTIVHEAPASFGDAMPQVIQVVAVCTSPFAGYQVNDQVPLGSFRIKPYPETPVFYLSAQVVGSLVTVRIRNEYGNIAGGDGAAIYDRNLTTGPGAPDPTLVAFGSVGALQSNFKLRVHLMRFEHGTGFGSLAQYSPPTQVLEAQGDVHTFSHGFGAQPTLPVKVTLVNVVADGTTGHSPGDEVPIHTAFESGFANPAYGVTVTNTAILVRREATTIQIPHKSTGALVNLGAEASWQMRATAARGVNLPSISFPASTFTVANPMFGISYGNQLYINHFDRFSQRTFLSRCDMSTNQVTLLHGYNPGVYHGRPSILRLLDGATPRDVLFTADHLGVRRMPLHTDVETVAMSGNFAGWIVAEAAVGSGGYANPDLLTVVTGYELHHATTTQWLATRRTHNGASYTSVNEAAINLLGATTIVNHAAFLQYHPSSSHILGFMYNPVKRRLYLVTNNSGYLFVFRLTGATGLFSWWTGAPVMSELEFEKPLLLAGAGGDAWGAPESESFSLDYDTVSGNERAIVHNRRGHPNLMGSVVRIPWNE